MQATHFRMAEGVDAGLTNSAVRLLSWVRMGSKLVVSFATDGPAAAAAGIVSIASASTGIYTIRKMKKRYRSLKTFMPPEIFVFPSVRRAAGEPPSPATN